MAGVLSDAPAEDRAIMSDPAWRRISRANTGEALRQGAEGWTDESMALHRGWDFDLKTVRQTVTWWHGEPPERIANDFLGVVADRRVTDAAQSPDPVAALKQRGADYAPGDTDLAWTRITPWRTLVAGAFDTLDSAVTGATVIAPPVTEP